MPHHGNSFMNPHHAHLHKSKDSWSPTTWTNFPEKWALLDGLKRGVFMKGLTLAATIGHAIPPMRELIIPILPFIPSTIIRVIILPQTILVEGHPIMVIPIVVVPIMPTPSWSSPHHG
jgi:hypothetical protein